MRVYVFPTLFEANLNIDEWFKFGKIDAYVEKSRCLQIGVEVE